MVIQSYYFFKKDTFYKIIILFVLNEEMIMTLTI